jgi:hypothetical protein
MPDRDEPGSESPLTALDVVGGFSPFHQRAALEPMNLAYQEAGPRVNMRVDFN